MLIESLALLFFFILLGLIGIGPAFWLTSRNETRGMYALALAPVIGYALLSFIALPLYRYVAPVAVTALPVTILLSILSIALVMLARQRAKSDSLIPNWKNLGLPIAATLGIYLVMILPLLLRGIQFAIYQTNPSDAFVFMSLAETQRIVDWQTLAAGASFVPSNLAALERLGAMSPSSLFAARTLTLPVPISAPGTLAWFSELAHLPVERLYYAHHLVALLVTFPLTVVLGDMLKLPRPLKYLAAAAICIGFWVQYTLAYDKAHELASFPLVMLVTFAWIQLEQAPLGLLTRERILLALAATTLMLVFLGVGPLIGFAFLSYYAISFFLKKVSVRAILYQAATLALVFFLLLVTGQLDYQESLFRVTIFDAPAVEQSVSPEILDVLRGGPASLFGMSAQHILPRAFPEFTNLAATIFFTTIALVLLLGLGLSITATFQRDVSIPRRVMGSYALGALLLAIILLVLDIQAAAGRAIVFALPYLILGVTTELYQLALVRQVRWTRAALYVCAAWLVFQALLGVYLPFTNLSEKILAGNPRVQQFDLSKITNYLDNQHPQNLLVYVPDTKGWVMPLYVTMVFAKYKPYYQGGLIVDNSINPRNVWTQEFGGVPDYALVARTEDYIGQANVGTPVAETRDLILYKIHTTEPTLFQSQDAKWRALESAKPFLITNRRSNFVVVGQAP